MSCIYTHIYGWARGYRGHLLLRNLVGLRAGAWPKMSTGRDFMLIIGHTACSNFPYKEMSSRHKLRNIVCDTPCIEGFHSRWVRLWLRSGPQTSKVAVESSKVLSDRYAS